MEKNHTLSITLFRQVLKLIIPHWKKLIFDLSKHYELQCDSFITTWLLLQPCKQPRGPSKQFRERDTAPVAGSVVRWESGNTLSLIYWNFQPLYDHRVDWRNAILHWILHVWKLGQIQCWSWSVLTHKSYCLDRDALLARGQKKGLFCKHSECVASSTGDW